MEIKLFWSDKTKVPETSAAFREFAQKMANRLMVGAFRYSTKPDPRAKYLTRLKAEIKEYVRTGNTEHLINAANYCLLEQMAPEHPRSHFEHCLRSVTRDKLGMNL